MKNGPGAPGGKEMRPNYFNNVHGVAIDPQTREVYINDRGNHRIQIFDENGKFCASGRSTQSRPTFTLFTLAPTARPGSSIIPRRSSRSTI